MRSSDLAARMNVGQSRISHVETSTSLGLATILAYVRALGGDIEMTAHFPNAAFTFDIGDFGTDIKSP